MTGPEEDETAVVRVGLDARFPRPTLGVLEIVEVTGVEIEGLGMPRIRGL
jgi:hypothetical protein